MFSKPKAKAIAKPRTAEESIAVKRGVTKMYPQMSDPDWGKPMPKSMMGKVKKARKEQRAALEGGLTADEIKRLRGA